MSIKRIIRTNFRRFASYFRSGGMLMLLATVSSLVLANSIYREEYLHFFEWELRISLGEFSFGKTLIHWINDGFMAIFFLLVGLEIKREFLSGELANPRKAMLPLMAALGGMLAPALIYVSMNYGQDSVDGWGIPMATDIAFALAVFTLAGKHAPMGVRIFLTALAIIDDLGAILVIALFYSGGLEVSYLYLALAPLALMTLMNVSKVHDTTPYLLAGVVLWYFVLKSGVHATIAGVLTAFFIPYRRIEGGTSPLEALEHVIQTPVTFFIIPVFALANTAISIDSNLMASLGTSLSLGIILGLCLGKPIGIALFSYLAVKLKWAAYPENSGFMHILAAGMIGGIGFTMSIFIAMLAFDSAEALNLAKIAIMIASLISAVAGVLLFGLAKKPEPGRLARKGN